MRLVFGEGDGTRQNQQRLGGTMFVYRVNLLYMAPNQRKTFQGTFSVDPGTFLPDNRLQDGNSFSYWRPPAG